MFIYYELVGSVLVQGMTSGDRLSCYCPTIPKVLELR